MTNLMKFVGTFLYVVSLLVACFLTNVCCWRVVVDLLTTSFRCTWRESGPRGQSRWQGARSGHYDTGRATQRQSPAPRLPAHATHDTGGCHLATNKKFNTWKCYLSQHDTTISSYLLELKSNGRTEVSAFNEDSAEDAFLSCCRQHGVSQEDVIRGSEEQKMKDLVYDLASAAHGELEIVRWRVRSRSWLGGGGGVERVLIHRIFVFYFSFFRERPISTTRRTSNELKTVRLVRWQA